MGSTLLKGYRSDCSKERRRKHVVERVMSYFPKERHGNQLLEGDRSDCSKERHGKHIVESAPF